MNGVCETFPYGEGHMHIFMNGINYKEAVRAQQHGVDVTVIRKNLEAYRKRGITWLRDGGDIYGTSKRTMELALEYGITYRTPVFAIHKQGHYGGIVGKSFDNMTEYQELIREIDAKMTEEMLADICEGCGWFPISACRKNICKK